MRGAIAALLLGLVLLLVSPPAMAAGDIRFGVRLDQVTEPELAAPGLQPVPGRGFNVDWKKVGLAVAFGIAGIGIGGLVKREVQSFVDFRDWEGTFG